MMPRNDSILLWTTPTKNSAEYVTRGISSENEITIWITTVHLQIRSPLDLNPPLVTKTSAAPSLSHNIMQENHSSHPIPNNFIQFIHTWPCFHSVITRQIQQNIPVSLVQSNTHGHSIVAVLDHATHDFTKFNLTRVIPSPQWPMTPHVIHRPELC